MGMQRFEVQFPAIFIVFGNESKSCSKLVINQVAGALGISNQFYWLKSLMGTPVDRKTFTPKIFFQLRTRAQEGIQIKICFGTIKDLCIGFFSNKGIFVSQNSYGHTVL